MDFITHLPKVGDFEAILVIINRFSKYAIFVPTTKLCSIELTAQLFFKHIVKLWGVMTSILSDRDGRFIGTFWIELLTFLGTSLNKPSSYNPQTDGQTKRFNSHNFTKEWKRTTDIAQAYLEKASKSMKKRVNKKRRSLKFCEGDRVFVKLKAEQV
ncbi:reverse transcriptase [Cucumis melo var. makuwa]|uniref:Reverse transcriptase n=1 Tax=Cucumis melo var. makuwa TaxID=1194695 RepID=A0A5D3BZ80_CUCMM|nr:reverse transcriptase [Cucumis melo var. makuwa]TYK04430.1 reverse transcriptase [Cucumis melo var. makuwa]